MQMLTIHRGFRCSRTMPFGAGALPTRARPCSTRPTRLPHRIQATTSGPAFPSTQKVEREESVEAAKSFIEEHLDEPLDVERLSREANLNKYHFSRVFREVEGTSPWAYVLERRVRKARELLERGLPLSEVALDTGFCDQSHLTKVFKDLTGTTPGAYRKRRTNLQDGDGRRG